MAQSRLNRWLPWRRDSATAQREHPPKTPLWAQALQERLHTVARAQSKLSLRLDDVVQMLEERLPPTPLPDPAPLLDALDRLNEAQRVLASDNPAVAQGLASIGARLEGLLGAMGVDRRAEIGVPADPKLFRVVGIDTTSASASLQGVVTRVIRAAAVRGTTQLIREGEVLVSRTTS